MRKFYLLFGLALSVLAAGCSKEPTDVNEDPSDEVSVQLTATIMDEGVVWETGTEISVNGVKSSALETGGESTAVFEIAESLTAPLKVISPASVAELGDVVRLPDVQNYVAGSYDKSACVMVGYVSELPAPNEENVVAADVSMYGACGVISVPVAIPSGATASLKTIALTSNKDEEYISGEFEIDFSTGSYSPSNAYNSIDINCGEEGVALGEEPVYFRFVVPAGVYSGGFYVTATDANGLNCIAEYDDAVTVEIAKETQLAPMTFVGAEPQDVTINATIDSSSITWSAEDKIVVNNVLSSAISEGGAGTAVGNFAVEQVAYPYSVFYPAALYTSSGRLRFLDTQNMTAGSFDREALALIGYSTDTEVTMKSVCGIVTIPITNNYDTDDVLLTKIDITANNGEPLSGRYQINYRNGTISAVEPNTNLTLVSEEGVLIPMGETVRVSAVIPAGLFPNGLTLTLESNVSVDTKECFTSGLELKSGQSVDSEEIVYTEVKIDAIRTPDELFQFVEAVNNGRYSRFVNEEGEVVLGNDIDLSGLEWTIPISDWDGIFNGKGYAIKNWTSSESLFKVSHGTVKNLVLDASCKLTYPNPNTLGAITYFGFVVGENYGTVDGCVNNADVTLSMAGESLAYQLRSGAIIGQSQQGARISNCINNGNVTMNIGNVDNTATGASCTQYWGTVQGSQTSSSDAAGDESLRTIMSNCSNYGNLVIRVSGDTCRHGLYIGGVSGTGNSYSELDNCNNYGSIQVDLPIATSLLCIGGVTAYSAGPISNCTNEGSVTLACASTLRSTAIGGVTGYQNGPISACNNSGAINVNFVKQDGTATIGSIGSKSTSAANMTVGGISGLGYSGGLKATMDGCTNTGNITVKASDITGCTTTGRFSVAGCFAAPWGDVTNCRNTGKIDVSVVNPAHELDASTNLLTYVGGIAASDYYPKTQLETNVIDCTNEGAITVDLVCSKSNSTVGGIIGWPGKEATSDKYTQGCTNTGSIVINGYGKVRAGGIQGGTGNIRDCENRGNITVNSADLQSAIGGMAGFHTQTNVITDSRSYGNVVSKVNLGDGNATGGVSGLIGNFGNVANDYTYGNIVNCTVQTAGNIAGMLVAQFNGYEKIITFGNSENPIYVSGRLIIGGTETVIDSQEKISEETLFGYNDKREGNTYHIFSSVLYQ